MPLNHFFWIFLPTVIFKATIHSVRPQTHLSPLDNLSSCLEKFSPRCATGNLLSSHGYNSGFAVFVLKETPHKYFCDSLLIALPLPAPLKKALTAAVRNDKLNESHSFELPFIQAIFEYSIYYLNMK